MSLRAVGPTHAAFTVRVDTSAAFEFLTTLVVAGSEDREHYEVGAAWFRRVDNALSEALRDEIEAWGNGTLWPRLYGFVLDCPAPRDVGALVEYLAETDAADIRLRLLGYATRAVRRRTTPQTILDAANGDGPAQRRLLAAADPEMPEQVHAIRTVLAWTPASTKQKVLALFRRWNEEVFGEWDAETRGPVSRAAERIRASVDAVGPDAAIERATNGIQFIAEPGIRGVVIAPSVVVRPYVRYDEQRDVAVLVCPVDDESMGADAAAPPARLVRLSRAFADERRLRILKRLTADDYTLQELSEHFEIPKSTMLHHLVILRSAGVVRLKGSPTSVKYSLRDAAVFDQATMLEEYLARPSRR
jgi:DNA-binding transcriptional ArsR family regulator